MSDILLKGGHLVDPASGVADDLDVLIKGNRVAAVGKGLAPGGAEVIDVSGRIVTPGFVDLHVHLREPGREDEETVATGSTAAVLGGFTAIQAMPNTDPVCDNAAVAEKVWSEGRRVGLCKVIPSGAITMGLDGKQMAAIGEMFHSPANVRMFTDDGKGVQDSRLLRRAMEYIRGFDGICAEHCDEASLSEGGHMHEGEISEALGLKGMPAEAEEVALARDLALARLTGVRFHALHLSTAGSAELIRAAKAAGIRVTAEVTPHHLTRTDAELTSYDTHLKVNPPLRTSADVDALREALAQGVIDAIATDHAPHSPEEKESEFELAPPGMLGLETALAVVVTSLVKPGHLDLIQLVRLMSLNPARILGLEGQGGPVVEGAAANLTVFDLDATWNVSGEQMSGPSRNTPWEGATLTGRVTHTISSGVLVVRDGALLAGATV